ncbi:hypothetical protein ABT354_04460 [Streptomyces sp. NPDC000594]|uniref:hypothetical protein n=1 Tax=Streptomyces sp. NPDC000594 TaxID=3154261 RepID=UPI0033272FB9
MNPHRKRRPSPAPDHGRGRPVRGGLIAAGCVIVPLVAVGADNDVRAAVDFTTGVLSLVCLTASVAWGLIATDRLLLTPRQRLLSQAVHRVTATAALGFLLLHAAVKISLDRVDAVAAFLPFALGLTGTAGLIGFGSLAGLLMVVAGATGALRSALAGNGRIAGRWRALHMLAYPAWCFALLHGLFTGRPAAGWVVILYGLAVLVTAVALALRLLPRPVRRLIADRVVPAAVPIAVAVPGQPGDVSGAVRPPVVLPRPGGPSGGDRPAAATSGRARPTLSAPAPRLYEAPPPSAAVTAPAGTVAGVAEPSGHPAGPARPGATGRPVDTGGTGGLATPAGGTGGPAVRPGGSGGTGFAAGYRAVSRTDTTRTAHEVPYDAPTEPLPRAGHPPAADEIPVVHERPAHGAAPTGGRTPSGASAWPAPTPPPPYPVLPPEPPRPSPVPEPPRRAPGHRTPTTTSTPPGTPYGTPRSTEDTTPHNDTRTAPGPAFPPPAGEPWSAPAGERP